jgi:hypothetical protein
VWFTVFAESCDEAYLACRKGYSGSFEFVEMFDDGAHNDGSAGDGVFGISRVVFNAGLQYYFYAENEDAAAFFPQRAANDFFTLSVSGSLVINEFLADNETTIADQDGEYDDWIEIYNNESQAINLGGYYLSDDLAAPDAWMFPDTIIEAGGYVVVWADKDEDQEGLHADIKLSKEGEAVILSNANLEVVDMIEFGAQQTDISTGRYENGTGEFISMTPTFGAENHNGIIGINESFSDISDIIVMPNPFSDKLTVVVDLVEASSVSMHMHSVGGQTIRMEECTYPCGRNSITLDTSSLNKGIWILTVRCNDAVMTRKVVK